MNKLILKYIRITALAVALALSAVSCIKAGLETIYDNQETRIESFINSLKSGSDSLRVERRNGSNRAVVTEGGGDMLSGGGNVAFYYAGYVFNGNISASNLFDTNHSETAAQAGWTLRDSTAALPVTLNLKKADISDGLRNGLYGVRGGEECYIVFSGKYGFGRKQFGTIPANSAIAYHIWVESVNND